MFWNGRGYFTRDWLFSTENMSWWWWDWWLDFSVAKSKILFGMVLADDMWLDHWILPVVDMSKKQWLLGKTQNRFHCNGIWITDIFSLWFLKSVTDFWYSYILAYFAANDNKDIFLDLFLGWNGTTTMFGMGMRHIRGVRSMDVSGQASADWYTFLQVKWTSNSYGWTFCANVGMEWKVSGTEGEGFMPNSSFHISLSTLQHSEGQNADKKVLVQFYDDCSHWQSCLHKKQRVLEYHVFDVLLGKGTLELSMTLCIQTSTWIRKWIFEEVLCQAFGIKVGSDIHLTL